MFSLKMSREPEPARQSVAEGSRRGLGVWAGYVLLFLSTLLFDQTSKFHAESSFLVWSHESDIRGYRGSKQHVFTLGVSPAAAREQGLTAAQVTPAWLDFHLTYVRNPGAAWGSFAQVAESTRFMLFYIVTALVGGIITYLLVTSHPGQRLGRAALVVILAGAAGNLIDRIALRYVIDWIQFHWKIFGWEYSFPVFNWADVAINVGLLLLVLDIALTEVAIARRNRLRSQH
ncbi:MAG: signal peptidase II [Silvanigrellales bacterium]|nr:signal peptidase II [Silvanigrellales bacterium]